MNKETSEETIPEQTSKLTVTITESLSQGDDHRDESDECLRKISQGTQFSPKDNLV